MKLTTGVFGENYCGVWVVACYYHGDGGIHGNLLLDYTQTMIHSLTNGGLWEKEEEKSKPTIDEFDDDQLEYN